MADDSAVRPPVRRIKIKLGKQLLATHVVRVPGLASSVSQDSKETKTGSALHLARLRQASLQGYVPPSATADAIVARLRDGEGFAPGAELPPWDFTAPPVASCLERPAKRPRPAPSAEDRCQHLCPVPSTEAAAAGTSRREGLVVGPGRPEPILEGLPVKVDPRPERAEAAAVVSVESNSDQATNSQAYLPLSPDDAGDGGTRAAVAMGAVQPRANSAGQSSMATTAKLDAAPPQRPRANPSVKSIAAATATGSAAAQPKEPRAAPACAAGLCSHSLGLAARGDVPSTSGREQPLLVAAKAPEATSGVSVETQTSQRDFPVLPMNFLELPRLCGTALSFQSIGPFDLQLEREPRNGLAEGRIEAHIEDARQMKRAGDHMFQNSSNKTWTIKSLSRYVTAALMFMEAADAMLARDQRREQRYNPRNAGDLYRQTADLLMHTVTIADSIKGNGIGKEALRLLAERLCAICLLRQTSLMAGNFKACAERAHIALREHQRQQVVQSQAAGAGAAAGPSGGGQQPSPEDSSTSSLHAAQLSTGPVLAGGTATGGGGSSAAGGAAHGGAGGSQPLAGFGHEHVSELVGYARTAWRFSEFMKRSSKSFEAFLERPDVRQDQQAKLVCMHLAAVCMDVGMTPGMRVIHHAREAVRTLCEDLAR